MQQKHQCVAQFDVVSELHIKEIPIRGIYSLSVCLEGPFWIANNFRFNCPTSNYCMKMIIGKQKWRFEVISNKSLNNQLINTHLNLCVVKVLHILCFVVALLWQQQPSKFAPPCFAYLLCPCMVCI